MPRSQKANERPISFVLHDTTNGSAPVTVPMAIRPEDLSRSEQSRLTICQTLGGAWADSFGPSVPTVTLSGHTGWGAGDRPDGFEQFQLLHKTVFDAWHEQRDAAAKGGYDPNDVKLIFVDALDEFTWVVAPGGFVLRRNRSRPLLSQYQIILHKLADGMDPTLQGPPIDLMNQDNRGLSSLDASIATIIAFGEGAKGAIGAALGPIKDQLTNFVNLSTVMLTSVRRVIAAGNMAVSAINAPLLEVAGLLTKAGRNIFCMAASILSFPMSVRQTFMRTAAAYTNAFCLFSNVFKLRKLLPDYSSVYGASNCSSTAGGEPGSIYASLNANVFKDIFSNPSAPVSASQQSLSSLTQIANMDIVQAPLTLSELALPLKTVMSGIRVLS